MDTCSEHSASTGIVYIRENDGEIHPFEYHEVLFEFEVNPEDLLRESISSSDWLAVREGDQQDREEDKNETIEEIKEELKEELKEETKNEILEIQTNSTNARKRSKNKVTNTFKARIKALVRKPARLIKKLSREDLAAQIEAYCQLRHISVSEIDPDERSIIQYQWLAQRDESGHEAHAEYRVAIDGISKGKLAKFFSRHSVLFLLINATRSIGLPAIINRINPKNQDITTPEMKIEVYTQSFHQMLENMPNDVKTLIEDYIQPSRECDYHARETVGYSSVCKTLVYFNEM